MPELNNTLPPTVAQDLSHRDYERRMKAAEEVEKIIQQALYAKDYEKVESTVTYLTRRYVASDRVQDRLGGIAGFARCAVTLNTYHLPRFLPHIVPPIVNLLSDPEPRVKFYTCEALYNVMKVAKDHILQWFSDIFDGLALVMADTHSSVVKGGELVNKLLMDIVTEQAAVSIKRSAAAAATFENWEGETPKLGPSADDDSVMSSSAVARPTSPTKPDRESGAYVSTSTRISGHPNARHHSEFSLDEFIPLLANRLSAQKSQIRMYLIQWIRLFTEIRGFDLLSYLPSFLKGPIMFLDDKDESVRIEARGALADLLREVQKASDASRLTRSKNPSTSYAEWARKSEGADGEPLVSSHSKSGHWPNSSPSVIDYNSCVKILLSHIRSDDQETQRTALMWIHSFSWICPEVLVSETPQLIYAILPSLPNPGSEIQHIAEEVNAALFRLVEQSPSPKLAHSLNSAPRELPRLLDNTTVITPAILESGHPQQQTASKKSAAQNKSPAILPKAFTASQPPSATQSVAPSRTTTPVISSPAHAESVSKKLTSIPSSPQSRPTIVSSQDDASKKRPVPITLSPDTNGGTIPQQQSPGVISPIPSIAAQMGQAKTDNIESVDAKLAQSAPEAMSSSPVLRYQKVTSQVPLGAFSPSRRLDPSKIIEPFNYDDATTAIMDILESSTFEAPKISGMRWLLLLHQKAPWRILTIDDLSFKIILKLLTDPSEEIVRLNLLLVARISLHSEAESQANSIPNTPAAYPVDISSLANVRTTASQLPVSKNASPYLLKFISALLQMLAADRPLLEKRAGLIVRQLCIVHDPQNLFQILAELLHPDNTTDYSDDFDPTEIKNASSRHFNFRPSQSHLSSNPKLADKLFKQLNDDFDTEAPKTAPAATSTARQPVDKGKSVSRSPESSSISPFPALDTGRELHPPQRAPQIIGNLSTAKVPQSPNADISGEFYRNIQKNQQNRLKADDDDDDDADSISRDIDEKDEPVFDLLQTGDLDEASSQKSSTKKASFSHEFVQIMVQHLTWILATSSETSALRMLLRSCGNKPFDKSLLCQKPPGHESSGYFDTGLAPQHRAMSSRVAGPITPKDGTTVATATSGNQGNNNRPPTAEGMGETHSGNITTGQHKRSNVIKRNQSPRPPSIQADNESVVSASGGTRGKSTRMQSGSNQALANRESKSSASVVSSSLAASSSIPRPRNAITPGVNGSGSGTKAGGSIASRNNLKPINEGTLHSGATASNGAVSSSRSKDQDFFITLYRTWVYNPVSTLILCFISQQYELASAIIPIIAESPITLNTLIQLDKMVQLLESPIFSHMRISLLEPWRFPYLYKALYRIMLILPQSSAFATLRNRLNGVPIFSAPPFSCPAPSFSNPLGIDFDGTMQSQSSQRANSRATSPPKKESKHRRSSLTNPNAKQDDATGNTREHHRSSHNNSIDSLSSHQIFMQGYQYAQQQMAMQRQMSQIQLGPHDNARASASSSSLLSTLAPPSPTIAPPVPGTSGQDYLSNMSASSSSQPQDESRIPNPVLNGLLGEFKQVQSSIDLSRSISQRKQQQQQHQDQQRPSSPSTSMTF